MIVVFGMLFGLPVHPPAAAQHAVGGDSGYRIDVLRSDESGLLLELITSGYQIDALDIDGANYDLLRIDGAGFTSEQGMPQLPKIDALIGVPPDVDIRVLVHSADASPLPGRLRLPPSPQPAASDWRFRAG